MNGDQVKQAALTALESYDFAALERVPFTPSKEILERLAAYCALLWEHNKNINLVSNAEPDVVVTKHVLDSLSLVEYIQPLIAERSATDNGPLEAIDIGSGAGFPGLVLSIALPELHFTLVDSVGKKTRFLQSVVEELSLTNRVSVETGRLEEMGHQARFRQSFDVSTSRAVGHLALVSELTLPCLKLGGWMFCQKTGAQAQQEIAECKPHIRSLGGRNPIVSVPELKEADTDRCIVAIEKINTSKSKYPRIWSTIKRDLDKSISK